MAQLKKNAIQMLEDLIIAQKAEPSASRFKINAFQQGITAIKKLDGALPKTKDKLMKIEGIGKGIAGRILELIDSGTVEEWEEVKENHDITALDVLTSVLGIGNALAKKLIEDGIETIEDLKTAVDKEKVKLTTAQSLGLKYHKALQRRIPREEVQSLRTYLVQRLKTIDKNIKLEIAGSYRRRSKDCGDVDVLIYHPNITTAEEANESDILKRFVEDLEEKKIMIRVSLGSTKYMGLANWPRDSKKIAHTDIRFVPAESYISALAYFTGSRENNIEMRKQALKLGYKLNEYGLFNVKDNSRVPLESEKQLYELLDMKYLTPSNR